MRDYVKFLRIALVAVILVLGLSQGASAQEITGSIVGSVVDSNGAVVVGATVTASIPSQDNKVIRTVTTSDDGTFSIPNVPTNTYSITVEAPNFKKFVQTDVVLEVGQRRPVEVVLEPGNVQETVTVRADAVAVETTTPTSSTSITGEQVRELSVNNRNWIQFVTLAPGVSNNLADLVPVGSFSPDGSPAIVAISVNGARQSQNTFTVDGADITDRGSNITLQAFPSLDSIGELKVLRSLYPAESGRSGGGQVNIVTRSGTDKFHGSLFEFVRNEKLNANSFLANRNKPSGVDANGKAIRPPFRYNNYGFTLSGPIYFFNFGEDNRGVGSRIPKTYFFFSEEQRKDRRYSLLSGLVPTLGMRNGVFTFPICLSGTITGTTRTCSQILPAGTPLSSLASINSASAQYLTGIFQKEPAPNSAPFGIISTGVGKFDFRQEIIKIDTSFTKNWAAYYRHQRDQIPVLNPNSVFSTPCNVPNVCPGDTNSPGRTHTFSTTYVVTPSVIVEGRYTYAFGAIIVNTQGLMASANTPISVAKPYDVPDDRVPFVTLTGLSTLQAFGPYNNFSNKHDVGGNVTWISGRHTFKFGGNYSKYRKNEDNGLGGTGQGSFSAFFNTTAASATRGTNCVNTAGVAIACPAGQQTTEQNFANFLLGRNVTFTQTKFRLTADFRQQNFESYAQDEFRMKRNLTVYLGVRYSYFGAPYAANGLLTNFVPELWNPAQAPQVTFDGNRVSGSGNFCNGIIVNAQNYQTGPASYQCTPIASPYGKYIYKAPTRNFAPRFGLAWDPTGKGTTVIRTGYGIYHEQTLVGHIETHLGNNPPYQETITISGGSVSQPIPTGTTPAVVASLAVPALIRGVDTDYKTPYMQHWSLDVQHLFSKKTIVSVGYYGSKGTHLIGVTDLNNLPPGLALTRTCVTTAGGATGPCQARDGTGTPLPFLSGAASLVLDQIRPFRGWRGISMVQPKYNSNYHSLQVSATQRFTGSSQIQLAYTWSKNLTDNQSDRSNAAQNNYDTKAEYGRAVLDRRHIFTTNYVYELPFFKKQEGFSGKVLGGWQASGIVTYQTGLPFTPTYSAFDPSGIGFLNASSPAGGRPYQFCNANQGGQQSFEEWFNYTCFQSSTPAAAPASPGNAGRGVITGPPTFRIDFTMTKNFRFGETTRLQIRAEAFNVMNHTNFTTLSLAASTPHAVSALGIHSGFGTVTATRDPRTIQLGAKFIF
jgi:hypothetical protein